MISSGFPSFVHKEFILIVVLHQLHYSSVFMQRLINIQSLISASEYLTYTLILQGILLEKIVTYRVVK